MLAIGVYRARGLKHFKLQYLKEVFVLFGVSQNTNLLFITTFDVF